MNEEEKKAIEKFSNLMTKHFEDKKIDSVDYLDYFEGITILNLIDKQQKEIEKQQKEIKARLKEIDSLYKMMSAKDDKIEGLKEDYQILKDDIEGHRIAYVDTPEFEENYISKDKIKEKIEKIKEDEEFYRERDRMYEFDGKINILKDLLGE